MALTTEPTYITIEEFQANARVAAQQAMDEEALTPYILHAERMIDSLVGNVERYDEDQNMKFPTKDDDGEYWMPDPVKIACIEITSMLILEGEPTLATFSAQEQSQEWNANGYRVTYKNTENRQSFSLDLPSFVVRTLRPWLGHNASLTY